MEWRSSDRMSPRVHLHCHETARQTPPRCPQIISNVKEIASFTSYEILAPFHEGDLAALVIGKTK